MAGETVVTPAAPAAVVVVAPAIGTPEYDAAMIAKFESRTAAPAAPVVGALEPAVKPEGVPEKFWDAAKGEVNFAAWGKSTAELEAARTKAAQTAPAAPAAPAKVEPTADQKAAEAALAAAKTPEEKTAAEALKATADTAAQAAADKAASDAMASKGLDMAEFTAEFTANQTLSEASYEKLAKAGIPKEMVDGYIDGQLALRASQDAAGYDAAGGKEQFAKMADWSRANMTEGERTAFNNAVAGTPEQMKLAVAGLRARYEAANGSDPKLLGGNATNNNGIGYASRAEMTTAMRDPRYAKDPAYRATVEQKVAASTAF